MPILNAEQQADFVNQIGGGEGAETDTTPAESAPAAPPAPALDAAAPAAGGAPPTAKEVDTVESLKAKIEAAEKGRDEYVENALVERLHRMASQSAEHYRMVYGQAPPPGLFKDIQPKGEAQPGQKPPSAEQALQARLDKLEKAEAERAQSAQMEKFYSGMDSAMSPHKVYEHPLIGDAAQARLWAKVRENPRQDINKVAKTVADEMSAALTKHEDGIKAQYVDGKKATAKATPAGAGKAGAPVPGPTPKKLKMGDGSTREALLAEVREAAAAQREYSPQGGCTEN